MPTYEYQCKSQDCGHVEELFQSIKARTTRKCPICGDKSKRLIGAGAGIIFKGSGFYITDYRSKEYKDKAKAESSSSKPTSSKSDGKTDASKKSTPDSGSSQKSKNKS